MFPRLLKPAGPIETSTRPDESDAPGRMYLSVPVATDPTG